jgi:hypothetical protein
MIKRADGLEEIAEQRGGTVLEKIVVIARWRKGNMSTVFREML